MKDELPSKLKRGYYVINLQSSNVGNGSHWTALYYSPENSFYLTHSDLLVRKMLKKELFHTYIVQHKYRTLIQQPVVIIVLLL